MSDYYSRVTIAVDGGDTVTFGGGNAYLGTDWIVTGYTNEPPQPRYNFVEVPGRDGAVDLTRATTGSAPMGQRKLTFTVARFSGGGYSSSKTWASVRSTIDYVTGQIHGKLADVTTPDGVTYTDMEVAITKAEMVGYDGDAMPILTIECIGD